MTNGYTVKLVYYGRADFKQTSVLNERIMTIDKPAPQVGTQNIRIVAFSPADSEDFPEIAIYEMVANAPKASVSDIEAGKI